MFNCDVDLPPPQYDMGPTPIHDVQYVTREWLQEYTGAKLKFCGYTDTDVDPPIIFIVKENVSEKDQNTVYRHELGHVRGWRHPLEKGDRFSSTKK